jgi:selenide,water dikinase
MRRYLPQRDYLKLISTGRKSAVADKWGLPLSGRWLWRWKDRIDRAFMARFDPLPGMPVPALPARRAAPDPDESKPLCGGCGAKVGRDALGRALAALPDGGRPDILTGPGDDAAILSFGGTSQVLTTDHLRAVTEDPWLMGRIAAVHALGDIWAMGAHPQAALAQVILPRMSARLQERTLAEILDAAGAVLATEGAAIAGGHTTMGSELTVGFTVTGLADRPVTLAGARPGDRLILTKPLGTGVILAAEMARAAPGAAVAATLSSMARPQGAGSAILAPVARAMTDITGFGLAGHLLGILEASRVSAIVSLATVPLLPGAEALSAAGHASSLFATNRESVAGQMNFRDSPRARLLFDPQTGGGLLASVPSAEASRVLAELERAGLPGADIGEIADGPPGITVVG